MHDTYLLAIVNLGVCTGIAYAAFCRLFHMNGDVLRRVQSEYAVYMGGALACGLQPLVGEWPGYGTLALSVAVLVGLLCSAYVWRNGVPHTAKKDSDATA